MKDAQSRNIMAVGQWSKHLQVRDCRHTHLLEGIDSNLENVGLYPQNKHLSLSVVWAQ
jgi:hypothetical protein